MAKEGPKVEVLFYNGHRGNPRDGFGRGVADSILCFSVVGGDPGRFFAGQ